MALGFYFTPSSFTPSTYDDVISLKFEGDAVVVQTALPDVFYARLTELAATGELGSIHEVTSPDDNLEAVEQDVLLNCFEHLRSRNLFVFFARCGAASR